MPMATMAANASAQATPSSGQFARSGLIGKCRVMVPSPITMTAEAAAPASWAMARPTRYTPKGSGAM